jgi:hypothetical protein
MAMFQITPDAFGPRWVRILRVVVDACTYFFGVCLVAVLWITIRHYWLDQQNGNWLSAFTVRGPGLLVRAMMMWAFLGFMNYWVGHRKRLQVELSKTSLLVEGNSWYGAKLLQKDEIGYVRENKLHGIQSFLRPAGLHVGDRGGKIDIFIPAGTPGYEQIRSQLLEWSVA